VKKTTHSCHMHHLKGSRNGMKIKFDLDDDHFTTSLHLFVV